MLYSLYSNFIAVGTRKIHQSTLRVYSIYVSPFVAVSIILGLFTLTLSGWYLFEHFYSYSIDGLMSLLEIHNNYEIRPILSMVDFSTRILPSLIIFSGTSIGFIFMIAYLAVVFMFPSASWKVCNENLKVEIKATTTVQMPSNAENLPNPPPYQPYESHMRQPPTNPNYPVLPEKIDR